MKHIVHKWGAISCTIMMMMMMMIMKKKVASWAFEKYKFGKQSRWQYRLPIIVPSSVQPQHSHLPAKKLMIVILIMMATMMMVVAMAMFVEVVMMFTMNKHRTKNIHLIFCKSQEFLKCSPGFVQISAKDFCIARFHFCLLQFVHRAI